VLGHADDVLAAAVVAVGDADDVLGDADDVLAAVYMYTCPHCYNY